VPNQLGAPVLAESQIVVGVGCGGMRGSASAHVLIIGTSPPIRLPVTKST